MLWSDQMRRLALVLTMLAGCLSQEFGMDTTEESTLSVKLGRIGGPCEGTNSNEDEDGSVTIIKTTESGTCKLRVEFTTRFLKIADVRAEVAERTIARGHKPEQVKILGFSDQASSFLIHDIKLTGVSVRTAMWRGDLAIEGMSVANFKERELAAIDTTTLTVPMTSSLSDVVLRGYHSNTDVQATGVVELSSIPLAQWSSISPEVDVAIEFGVTAKLHVHGEYAL